MGISVTTLQPLHACFSLENGELVEVCLVIYLRHRISDGWTIIMKLLDFLTHKTLITDSIKALQAGFSVLVQSLRSA